MWCTFVLKQISTKWQLILKYDQKKKQEKKKKQMKICKSTRNEQTHLSSEYLLSLWGFIVLAAPVCLLWLAFDLLYLVIQQRDDLEIHGVHGNGSGTNKSVSKHRSLWRSNTWIFSIITGYLKSIGKKAPRSWMTVSVKKKLNVFATFNTNTFAHWVSKCDIKFMALFIKQLPNYIDRWQSVTFKLSGHTNQQTHPVDF